MTRFNANGDGRETLQQRRSAEWQQAALNWLEQNFARVQALFTQPLVRDFVLEPFTSMFDVSGTPTEQEVHKTITAIALANGVMAAIPGSMGLGVPVAIALELYMAFRIAQLLGFRVHSLSELLTSLSAAAGAVIGAGMVFRAIWGAVYSVFGFVVGPGTILTFATSYTTTLALGLLYWLAFEELRKSHDTIDSIRDGEWRHIFPTILRRGSKTVISHVMHHLKLLRGLANMRTMKLVGERLRAYFTGDLVTDTPTVRGDLFVPVAMAALLGRHADRLDGPMGEMFLDSVRQAWPTLADATPNEMADHFAQYDEVQLEGAMNLLRGQMFERLAEAAENADGDVWTAELYDDRSVPGSDLTFTNLETGDVIEVSLKATDEPAYLEEALARYPDIPIVTTDEVAGIVDGHPLISASGISNVEVTTITGENFHDMMEKLPNIESGIAVGIGLSAFAALYPYLIARARNRIDSAQLKRAVYRVTGSTSQALVSRLAFAAMLGPVFGWYLLARGSGRLADLAHDIAEEAEARQATVRKVSLTTRPPVMT